MNEEFSNKSFTATPTEETDRDISDCGTVKKCLCEGLCVCNIIGETSPLRHTQSDGSHEGSSYGSTSSSPELVIVDGSPMLSTNLAESIRCACHVRVADKTSRKVRLKLIIACFIALVFMLGEVAGGYFSSSLAILTDAAHMLSDFASFLISLFSLWMATRQPSKRMSFGWHRAEVIGALVSVLIIWIVTGILCYKAVMRIIQNDTQIDADVMLITACVGVFVNVFMCMVLHQHDHGHDHGHGHVHGPSQVMSYAINDDDQELDDVGSGSKTTPWWRRKKYRRVKNEETAVASEQQRDKRKKETRNINVRAAFIHVIGDLVQSIGVLIAGYIIKFWPQFSIVDPICTFLFSILVIFTTLNVLRDAMLVIMEGVPRHINTEQVKSDLQNLENVRHAHSIHVWSLTMSRTALAAHLAVDSLMHSQIVLESAGKMLKVKYGFAHTTIQVEKYQEEMSLCRPCQGSSRSYQGCRPQNTASLA